MPLRCSSQNKKFQKKKDLWLLVIHSLFSTIFALLKGGRFLKLDFKRRLGGQLLPQYSK